MLEVSQVINTPEPLIIGLVGNKQVCLLVTYTEQKSNIATHKAYSCPFLPFLSTFSFLRVNERLEKKIHPSGKCHINMMLANMDYNQII